MCPSRWVGEVCELATAPARGGTVTRASGSRSSQFINGGVYLLQRQLLDSIPFGQGVSLEKKIFPELVEGGLYGFPAPGFFIDIGVPADFIKAQVELVRRFSA